MDTMLVLSNDAQLDTLAAILIFTMAVSAKIWNIARRRKLKREG
jgi:hypothetical protein